MYPLCIDQFTLCMRPCALADELSLFTSARQDGGSGGEFSLCGFGTDCLDCGGRTKTIVEVANMKAALIEGGLDVTGVTSTSSISDWTSSTVVLPEDVKGSLKAASPAGAFELAIRGYVSSGGVYVVASACAISKGLESPPCPRFSRAQASHSRAFICPALLFAIAVPSTTHLFLKTMFEMTSIVPCTRMWETSTKASDLSGHPMLTAYSSLPDSLPTLNAMTGIITSSLPAGSHSIYQAGVCTTVALIPYGAGFVVALGPDFFQRKTEWDAVLQASAALKSPPRPPPPLPVAPPLGLFPPSSPLPDVNGTTSAMSNASILLSKSNPGLAVLGELLTGPSAATARAAAVVTVAAAVTSSVAASASASASGGSAGGGLAGAVPALLGAQRFAMYGRMGSAVDEDEAAPDPMGWVSGSFNLVSSSFFAANDDVDQESRRRHLSGAKTATGRSQARASNATSLVQGRLLTDYADRAFGNVLAMAICITVRYLILIFWLVVLNKKYYKWAKQMRALGVPESDLSIHPEARGKLERRSVQKRKSNAQLAFAKSKGDLALRAQSVQVSPAQPAATTQLESKSEAALPLHSRSEAAPPSKHRRPAFHGLPAALLWPNPEVAVMLVFSGGLAEVSMSLIAASVGGVIVPTWALSCAIGTLVLLCYFFVSQLRQLARFYRTSNERCWLPADKPAHRSDIDDPILALLNRIGCSKLRIREQGEHVIPEAYAVEPQRTELALAEALNCGMGFRRKIARFYFEHEMGHYAAADADKGARLLERLQAWLGDGTSTRNGMAFPVVVVCVQVALQLNTGWMRAYPLASGSVWQKGRLIFNLTVQAFAAVFTGVGTANDLWNGWMVSAVYALEAGATAYLLASVIALESASGGGDQQSASDDNVLARAELIRKLSTTSAELLKVTLYVPLALVVYDTLVVPIVRRLWKAEGSASESLKAVIIMLVTGPFMLARVMTVGFSASASDLVEDFGESIAETSATMIEENEMARQGDPMIGLLPSPAAAENSSGTTCTASASNGMSNGMTVEEIISPRAV